jgi:hypothetical protein
MSTEPNPALLIERATTARIAALQDRLRRFRQEYEASQSPSPAHPEVAVTRRGRTDVHRRRARNDQTEDGVIGEVELACR